MSSSLASLSRAMTLGFFRDKTAMFFTILFPLMFLVIFGGIFKDQTASKVEIVQIGSVPLIDQIPDAQRRELDQVMEVRTTTDRDAAIQEVRRSEERRVGQGCGRRG